MNDRQPEQLGQAVDPRATDFLKMLEDQRNAFAKVMESYGEQESALKKVLATISNPLPQLVAKIGFDTAAFVQWQTQIREQWTAAFTQLEPILQNMRDLPARTRRDLRVLAQQGWYLDAELPHFAPTELAVAFETGRPADADRSLVDFFRERLADIRETVLLAVPERAGIFVQAFAAHERGEFNLSVPVFLAQAEGISRDHTGLLLFSADRNTKKPQLAAYVEGFISDPFRYALLSPLMEVHPIAASEKQRSSEFVGLNRHQVLHGESLTYGTEVNSLKAVSLVSYLVWMFDLAGAEAD
jgi:hypothetical protein